jgi:hypothetical protein
MTSLARRALFARKIEAYRNDMTLFFREVLRFEPDDWQERAARDVATSTKVTIRSGQGVGKTAFEAGAALWFLSCFPYARVVATAPTQRQLHDVLWSEIAKWQAKSPLLTELLKWTKTYIYLKGYEKRWFAVAVAAAKPENMQGFHEENMLFIVDEASGVDDSIMEAILGTLSGANNKLLMCGNPTRTSGVFYESHTKDRRLYKAHKADSEESPRTDKENIETLKRKYGAESNVVRVRVHGEFPLQEDDVFIPLSLIENSITTEAGERKTPHSIRIGCDVARFGNDKTIIGFKVDEKVEFYKKQHGQDTMKTADDIVICGETLLHKYRGYKDIITATIDDGGVGGGVVDRLRQIKRNNPERFKWLDVVPVKFGQRIKHNHYYDTTTYMTAIVKKLLQPFDEDTGEPKPVELILPDDDDVRAQFSCRKYSLTENSKIRIESKDAMKKRDLPSPDEADCVLLLCLPIKPKKRGANHE